MPMLPLLGYLLVLVAAIQDRRLANRAYDEAFSLSGPPPTRSRRRNVRSVVFWERIAQMPEAVGSPKLAALLRQHDVNQRRKVLGLFVALAGLAAQLVTWR